MASATSLTLGSGVTLLPAWSPLRLAYDAALLDQASDGRLVLGVGIAAPALWQRFGLRTLRMADRADEMLQALRALLQGEDGFHGELVSVDGRIFPLPARAGGPPVWVGGRVRRSALRAARFGDGWYAATSYRLSEIARMVAAYRLACSEAGREPGPIAVNRIVVVTNERKAAMRQIDALLARYVRIGSILGDDGQPVDQAGALALKDELILAGDLDQVGEGLERYGRAGVTHLQARVWPSDMPIEMVERTIRSLSGARSG